VIAQPTIGQKNWYFAVLKLEYLEILISGPGSFTLLKKKSTRIHDLNIGISGPETEPEQLVDKNLQTCLLSLKAFFGLLCILPVFWKIPNV
jgi:hypothetical protein